MPASLWSDLAVREGAADWSATSWQKVAQNLCRAVENFFLPKTGSQSSQSGDGQGAGTGIYDGLVSVADFAAAYLFRRYTPFDRLRWPRVEREICDPLTKGIGFETASPDDYQMMSFDLVRPDMALDAYDTDLGID
jgi:hypothetical protein